MFTRMIKLLVGIAAVISWASCATLTPNLIREVTENDVKDCTLLGNIAGSDSIFVGLSAAVGTKNAKARAMNQAVSMGATDVVWSQMGTSLTNEWVGKAYQCR
jgi:hypothetical protein